MRSLSKIDTSPNLASRLPEMAFTRSGLKFRPNNDLWDWVDGPFRVFLDFGKLSFPVSISVCSLKSTLLVFAKSSSPCHLTNLFNAFVHFLNWSNKFTKFETISDVQVSAYIAALRHHEKYRVGTLNVLLQKWVSLGLAGVEADCTQYLRELRKRGNTKGDAVRTRDPFRGPLSEEEYTALYKAVDAAFGREEIDKWVVVLTRILFACGGRISQYASLKISDVDFKSEAYKIKLPQSKTREVHARSSFKEFDLSPQTGRLIADYVGDLRLKDYSDGSALFPEGIVMLRKKRKEMRLNDDLFFGHCKCSSLSHIFAATLQKISPPSQRIGFEPIPISTQRFRYTFGTRLAEEGASKTVIADRLGHTDLQNVNVYFEASPKIVDNIDKAMGFALAPLSRVFMGRLIEDEQHSSQKGARGSRIIDFRVASAYSG